VKAERPIEEVFRQLKQHARPSQAFMVAGENKLTHGDVLRQWPRVAAYLQARGIRPADRVLIVSRQDCEVVLLYLGMLAIGATAIILNPQSTASELNIYVDIADPAAAFVDANLPAHEILRSRLHDRVGTITASNSSWRSRLGRFLGMGEASSTSEFPGALETLDVQELPSAAQATASSIAHILFTSGTTSQPKGVEISQGALFAHMKTLVKHLGYDDTTRILNPLPLHHTDGLTQGPIVALVAGGTVFRREPFSLPAVPRLLDSVAKDGITHLYAVPSMLGIFRTLGADKPGSFRTSAFKFIISSAEELPEPLWRSLEEFFATPVVNLYGLTETVSGSLYSGPDDQTRRVGSLGKPVACECRVVAPDGAPVAPGEVGELWLAGGHLMSGYFRAPAETAEVLSEGWFRTGDLVSVDSDGFYFLRGRKKNLIIRGGINLSPEEISRSVMEISGVTQTATLGVKDDVAGEQVVTCVVASKGVTETQVRDHCAERLAPAKQPTHILFFDQLPSSASGKVDIKKLRSVVLERLTVQQNPSTDVATDLAALAGQVFGCSAERIRKLSRLDEAPGWSSLAQVEFIHALERRFGVKLTIPEMIGLATLQQAEALVATKRAATTQN